MSSKSRAIRASVVKTVALGGLAAALVVAGWHPVRFGGRRRPEASAVNSTREQQCSVGGTLTTTTGCYLGIYEPSPQPSWTPVGRFRKLTGANVNVALYYSAWKEPFQTVFASAVYSNDAIPMVQIEPRGTSMAAIADGRYDSYLRSYAKQVQDYGHPVIIGFAQEPNGGWYEWGWGHTAASVWVAAWRHMVDIFRAAGARNVTWLWTVNVIGAGTGHLRDWWPGAQYVTWVGIDGYYFTRDATFQSVFASTIRAVRRFAKVPILISETASGQVAGPSKIAGIFSGIRAEHLLGFVWFDQNQNDPPYHQRWRLESSPGGLAAFRAAAKGYG